MNAESFNSPSSSTAQCARLRQQRQAASTGCTALLLAQLPWSAGNNPSTIEVAQRRYKEVDVQLVDKCSVCLTSHSIHPLMANDTTRHELPDLADKQPNEDAAATTTPSRRHAPQPLPPPIPPPSFRELPQHILLIYNVSKSSNIGPLIRTAVAFSCSAIVVVGARKLLTHGNKHTNRFATFRHYERLSDAITHLRAQHFVLVGLELSHDAVELSVQPPPFAQRTCFVPGNEGSGLSAHILPHIDRLVYIRQSGHGTASLNVSTATGIVLYAFQMWAQYPEQSREEDKDGEAGLAKYRVEEEKAVGSGGWKIPRQDTRQQPMEQAAVGEGTEVESKTSEEEVARQLDEGDTAGEQQSVLRGE